MKAMVARLSEPCHHAFPCLYLCPSVFICGKICLSFLPFFVPFALFAFKKAPPNSQHQLEGLFDFCMMNR